MTMTSMSLFARAVAFAEELDKGGTDTKCQVAQGCTQRLHNADRFDDKTM